MMYSLIPALLLGLIGSIHCVAMCGALSVMVVASKKTAYRIHALLYNLGRSITYGILAFLLYSLAYSIALPKIQQSISLGIGVLCIAYGAFSLFSTTLKFPVYLEKSVLILRRVFSSIVNSTHPLSSVASGMINGLLPCGLVYAALGGALMQKNSVEAVLFMLVFGVSTLPAMMLLLSLPRLTDVLRKALHSKTILSSTLLIVGCILLLRGLELGIPYVSPSMPHSVVELQSIRTNDTHCLPRK